MFAQHRACPKGDVNGGHCPPLTCQDATEKLVEMLTMRGHTVRRVPDLRFAYYSFEVLKDSKGERVKKLLSMCGICQQVKVSESQTIDYDVIDRAASVIERGGDGAICIHNFRQSYGGTYVSFVVLDKKAIVC